MLHSRGFAPQGCGKEEDLRKALEDIQRRILAGLPPEVTERMSPMGGYSFNHNVSFRVDGDARVLCDKVDRWLQSTAFKINGKLVRCVPEARPSRRRGCCCDMASTAPRARGAPMRLMMGRLQPRPMFLQQGLGRYLQSHPRGRGRPESHVRRAEVASSGAVDGRR